MARIIGLPFDRRHAGLVLLTHLVLFSLLPMAEGLHDHRAGRDPEFHDAQEECGHDGHRAECSLLLRTVPAVPAPASSPVTTAQVSVVAAPARDFIDPRDPAGSPILPRAPPLA